MNLCKKGVRKHKKEPHHFQLGRKGEEFGLLVFPPNGVLKFNIHEVPRGTPGLARTRQVLRNHMGDFLLMLLQACGYQEV